MASGLILQSSTYLDVHLATAIKYTSRYIVDWEIQIECKIKEAEDYNYFSRVVLRLWRRNKAFANEQLTYSSPVRPKRHSGEGPVGNVFVIRINAVGVEIL